MNKANGPLEWAASHNCQFGVPKFKLVDFNRQWKPHPTEPWKTIPITGSGVQLWGTLIKSEPFTKFLGTLMDRQLCWNEQHAAMVRKGQQWVAQFRWVARIRDEMVAQLVRQLYKAKALPRMLYTANIVLTPASRKSKKKWTQASQTRGIIRKLTSIQQQAALLITGAMTTTATDILNIHLALLPLPLEIKHH
ncbi:MAG: hypothetical protein NXY57DRAFT_906867 [Lentinula lateritia]|nr:MAG: hypothetical protein NXY57DRAFT_906867 [Lentinula lateritia]